MPPGEALIGKSKALAYLASRGELTEAARSAFNLLRGEVVEVVADSKAGSRAETCNISEHAKSVPGSEGRRGCSVKNYQAALQREDQGEVEEII